MAFDPLHVSSKASPGTVEAAGLTADSTASLGLSREDAPRAVVLRAVRFIHPCTLVSSDLGQPPLPPGTDFLECWPVAWEMPPWVCVLQCGQE